MKTYTAPHVVQIDSRLVPPGEPFTTDTGPGALWVEEKPAKAGKAEEKPAE